MALRDRYWCVIETFVPLRVRLPSSGHWETRNIGRARPDLQSRMQKLVSAEVKRLIAGDPLRHAPPRPGPSSKFVASFFSFPLADGSRRAVQRGARGARPPESSFRPLQKIWSARGIPLATGLIAAFFPPSRPPARPNESYSQITNNFFIIFFTLLENNL